ncbi:MAG: hypothetical protein DMG26_13545, partial [Acidobacteria bacterium]
MRVLVYGKIFPDSFARNIAATVEQMGHCVRALEESPNHRRLIFPAVEARRHRRLLRAAKELDPDLTLLTDGTVPPAVMDQLKLVNNGKIAAWYPDHLANLGRQYLLASDFDACFFKDPYMAEQFRDKLGINA